PDVVLEDEAGERARRELGVAQLAEDVHEVAAELAVVVQQLELLLHLPLHLRVLRLRVLQEQEDLRWRGSGGESKARKPAGARRDSAASYPSYCITRRRLKRGFELKTDS